MEAIRFKNVTFSYPLAERNALADICLSIEEGSFVVLCGKSGCGKSTLLRQMKKNLIPYGDFDGEVTYYGENIEDLDDRKSVSEIGFVQQNPDNQIVTDKVWHELAFGLESLGMSNATIKRRVAEMASYFDIQGWFRKNVSELSGGQKQLLNLASIMAMQPKVLILDEPTSQLDPIAASEFLQTIHRINRDLGTTVVISEHRLEELFPMADKVIVMDQGRVLACDEPSKIGEFLAQSPSGRHPMFYGLPSVMRIFADVLPEEASPLTIREGRQKLRQMTEDIDLMAIKVNFGEDARIKASAEANAKVKPVLELKDIWFRYSRGGQDVLRGLDFTVEKGKWYGLLGGNGAGKSTTLKTVSGIIKPQRGTIKINSDRLAMLPQNPQALFTEITCEEELYEAFHNIKKDEKEKFKAVDDMLQLMEINHLRKSNPYDLSGGEQQRLALGKILLLEPDLLLLDEPTKGLDPFFKRTLAKIIRKLVDEKAVTVFMVSHDIEFCAEYVDSCSMFFDGEIVSQGSPREFFRGNSFYTTTANKLARGYCEDAILCSDMVTWLKAIREASNE